MAAGQMLIALDFYLGPTQEIAIVGGASDDETRHVVRAVHKAFRPNRVVAFKSAADREAERIVGLLAGKPQLGKVTTYLCENFAIFKRR